MISRRTIPSDVAQAASLCKDVHKYEKNIDRNALYCISMGMPMYTFISDSGEILCIVGGSTIWEGVLQLNAIFTTTAYEHRIELARDMQLFLKKFLRTTKIHRLEATVRSDFSEGKKFLQFLGFKYEGTLKQYGTDKTDYDMFGKVN